MKKLMSFIFIIIVLLTACSSNDEDTEAEDSLPQENNTEAVEEENENTDTSAETDEGKETNSSGEQDIPELERAEISTSLVDEELIPFEDLEDEKKFFIDDPELTEQRIYYGNQQVITLMDRDTMLFDLKNDKAVWEIGESAAGAGENVYLEENRLEFSTMKAFISVAIDSGDIVDQQPHEEEDGFENYININGKYRSGFDASHVHITNQDTGEKVDIPVAEDDYVETVLTENALVTKNEDLLTSYENASGEQLAESEMEGAQYIQTSGIGDDLYVFQTEELSYDYTLTKMDAKTLEPEKQIYLKNANMVPVVTENAVYYYDSYDGELVSLDLDMEEELWRVDIDGEDYAYQFDKMLGDSDGVHAILRPAGENKAVYLNLSYEDGEVLNFVATDYRFDDNEHEFYLGDGKAYIRALADGGDGNVFHVFDKENVHRDFPGE
ncbi:hypothetical protein [Oceanobacillus neutriphilus]|uniref:DUF5050 domain-containing protein n=1 Tax=Oceanobacillus neutriphilus TaxID=531815 RepID=A0ABQ2P106_9BACI|nr:hypothetical protein [Oceanobacillus neutriphilus]GGP15561.1 hypothetical protein GCM10011346_43960 [Oceanobacillus neutriphilus]